MRGLFLRSDKTPDSITFVGEGVFRNLLKSKYYCHNDIKDHVALP